jgi:hypothetical protein
MSPYTAGKMCFASWSDFTEEFTLMFCPENEATTVLMLESDHYLQGKQNVEAYIDEFIQQVMANHDTAMAATAESTTQMGTSKGTLVEREIDDSDFVRSSR